MNTSLFVISDLHLGGSTRSANVPSFQMCGDRGQSMLAGFIAGLPASSETSLVRLVIAGDIVDFLAEEPFHVFTADIDEAKRKFLSIVERTRPVWDALRKFVGTKGGRLTLLLGNHDIELCLPGVRQVLLETIGPGVVDFVFDNEALVIGTVLIEHGNRYDAWNAVPHGALRRVRSQMSRKERVLPEFSAMPGSHMVVDVMNPLKKDFAWVDLLKPENEAVVPILVALGAAGVKNVWRLFLQWQRQMAVDYDEHYTPVDDEHIGASHSEVYTEAKMAVDGVSDEEISSIERLRNGIQHEVRERIQALLHQTFFRNRAAHQRAFAADKEVAPYIDAATRFVKAGFSVVVFGHTHHAKRVPIFGREGQDGVYLNTGTWADLMCIPPDVWSPDEGKASTVLADFVADLEANDLDKWRRPVPTYARIELDDGVVMDADVYFAAPENQERLSTDGIVRRLTQPV